MTITNILPNILVSFKTNYNNQNAYAVLRYNSLCLEILFLLYKDGLIDNYRIDLKTKKVSVKLKYLKNKPLIMDYFLLSKPSHKIYTDFKSTKNLNSKYDYFCISTSSGILSSRDLEFKSQIGGQLLFAFKLNQN